MGLFNQKDLLDALEKAERRIIREKKDYVGGHFVYNNTVLNSTKKNVIIILNTINNNDINFDTLVMNNLTEKLYGHRSDSIAMENRIISFNNYLPNDVESYLIDFAVTKLE